MMVPRSFKYSSPPAVAAGAGSYDEKKKKGGGGLHMLKKNATNAKATSPSPPRSASPERTPSATVTATTSLVTPSKPVAVPTPSQCNPKSMPSHHHHHSRRSTVRRRTSPAHDPSALPPAVAALLAVTAIPPRRAGACRRQSSDKRRISIDELVNEWKSDESLNASYGSSPALSILLEDAEEVAVFINSDERYLNARSVSCESMPSLEMDDRSLPSFGSPSTPGSLRSRKSSTNLRKEKARSLPAVEDAAFDHPLVPLPAMDDGEDELLLPASTSRISTSKPKSSFKSNLTTSLQALKNAAVKSISSFTLNSMTAPSQRTTTLSPFTDEMLWAHPYIFPRMTSESRPAIDGTPTQAQRRYLNPVPLTFEEQEAPFQQALHAPYLAEQVANVPTIQLQTYNRGKRKLSLSKRGGAAMDPQSEAGRAILGAATGVRQREVRENSDFLRVVVLEMNMRRLGKLEAGKARIWLPPRQEGGSEEEGGEGGVPKRWEGVSAY